MNYLSVCSGIEAATVAWDPIGFDPVAFAEIEPFSCALLAEHYPAVPNLGDMTRFEEWNIEQPDILVGGTPCQSYSVAGGRGGIDDPRGALLLVYLAIARRYNPRFIVWENVPGVLSSGGGRDFGTFLGELGKLGYGFAYRILNAQYIRVESHARAVPQRRRRVFVVGYLGDWRVAAAVLFESASLQGYSPPSRETGADIASGITASFAKHGGSSAGKDSYPRNVITQALTGSNGGPDDNKAQGGFYVPVVGHAVDGCKTSTGRLDPNGMDLIAFDTTQITHPENRSNPQPGGPAPTLAKDGHVPAIAHALSAEGFDASEDRTGRGTPLVASPLAGADGGGGRFPGSNADTAASLLPTTSGVRRLTPRECERLQGFPDDYTAITYRGKPATDSPRYRAIGNSMAVNVMRWIGDRVKLVSDILDYQPEA